MAKPKKLTLEEEVLFKYGQQCLEAGCPLDQWKNYSRAQLWLQPKQLQMAAAARSCDHRCPACEELIKAGQTIPSDCKECGPTAVGVGGARGGGKQVKTSEIMQFWRRKRLQNSKKYGKFECMIKPADTIQVGDYLIGSNGKPVYVVHKTNPEIRQFYRIEFDDGSSLETSDNHKWTVFDLSKRAPGARERGTFQTTVTSEWLSVQDLRYRSQCRFAIPILSGAVEPTNPTRPQLPPYALGYWLGNGDKQASTMSCHTQDADEIKSFLESDTGNKYEHRIYEEGKKEARILFNGWNQMLQSAKWPWHWMENGQRKIRVFDRSRIHIEWRNWSSKDRASLLAGLIDSDGTCVDGHMEFDSKDIALAMLVRSLVMSLGQKATLPTIRQPKKENWSVMYRVKCYPTIQLFRLSRKADKISIIRELKQSRRYITKIEKCGFHEGVCFTVDSPDHLYVAGQEYILTHNSAWMFSQICGDDAQRYPGLKILYLRKSVTAAREQIRGLLLTVCKGIPHNYREQAGTIEFPNGSYIVVKHFKDEKDIENFLGQEYDVIAVEELTTLTFDKWKNLMTCLRTSKPGWRPRFYGAWNWGGVGHFWTMQVFYKPWEEKNQTNTRYILARVDDNKFNNPEYINILRSLTGWKYKSWYLGDPHFQAGQFFTNWNEEWHVYPNRKVVIPAESARQWYASYDYGFAHPYCFHLHFKDASGNSYTEDEEHAKETVIEEQAENFKAMLRRNSVDMSEINCISAGKDCFSRKQDGRTIAMDFEDCGITLVPVEIDRINAWAVMQQRLGDVEKNIKPSWYINRRCSNLIAQIPLAQNHETRIGDIAKMNADENGEGGDDALESARNYLVSESVGPIRFAMPLAVGNPLQLICG